MRRLLLCIFFLAFARFARAAGHEYIVVVDVSASRNQQDLDDAKHFLSSLVNGLTFGDQVVAIQMQQEGLVDHPRRWSVTLPNKQDNYASARDRDALEGKKKGIRLVLPTFFQSSGASIQHTDIFSTLNIVSEYIRDNGGRPTTLVMLSDMLQSARGTEMEKAQRMPPRNFISSQRKQGLLPPLYGACVVAVGVDTASRVGLQVEHFWLEYFQAAGAHLSVSDYRYTPPASMDSVCR